MWESHAELAGVNGEELSQFRELNSAWQLAKLTGWTIEYIRDLTPQTVRHIFAIEEGVAKAREK